MNLPILNPFPYRFKRNYVDKNSFFLNAPLLSENQDIFSKFKFYLLIKNESLMDKARKSYLDNGRQSI